MADTTLFDPLGRKVRLHDQTWIAHILRRHPEMAAHRAIVENAISNPLEIRLNPSDADGRLYFGAGPRAGIVVLVAVDIAKSLVKTAHLVRNMKGGIEWSRPTP